jgi:hypothetical protein
MYRHLGENESTDFEQFQILPEGSTIVEEGGKYSRGLRDRPRFVNQSMGQAGHPMISLPSFKHPMAAMSGLWDTITSTVSSAITSAIPKAETAATEALNKVAAGMATDVLAKPAVQAAVSDTVKTQATQALAQKIQATAASTSAFVTKYQKPLLFGSLGLIAALIVYKKFMPRGR